MIYQFTGQPGHGKTLSALKFAAEFGDQGRLVYACNVRGLDHAKAKMLPLTPDGFKDWQSLPDGSVILVDECYEHGMLPKRSPGSKVPDYIQQLAKHRHRGFDFIFVTQSPSKQMDEFVHDLIERHVHVRRRFGLPFVHLRTFDRYERNPEKSHPLSIKRVGLPKRAMGWYESTTLDTTQKGVPWYYYAAGALCLFVLIGAGYSYKNVTDTLSPKAKKAAGAHGAPAKGAPAATPSTAENAPPMTTEEYLRSLAPRVSAMPFSMPALDGRKVVSEPAVYCMSSADSCTCLTEQGTRYKIELTQCIYLAKNGPVYNPFKPAERVKPAEPKKTPPLSERDQLELVAARASGIIEDTTAAGGR
jgi:zona occludens toxin (predicted ATPase)